MDRNCVLRLNQGVNKLDVLLAGMSRYMNILENNLRAFFIQLIDDIGDRLLISGNRMRGEYNQIAGLNCHLLVDVRRHSRQGCHRLSLASGGDKHHLTVRIISHLIDIDERILRHIQISEFLCDGDDIHHASAFYNDLTAEFAGGIDDLLHTVNI